MIVHHLNTHEINKAVQAEQPARLYLFFRKRLKPDQITTLRPAHARQTSDVLRRSRPRRLLVPTLARSTQSCRAPPAPKHVAPHGVRKPLPVPVQAARHGGARLAVRSQTHSVHPATRSA